MQDAAHSTQEQESPNLLYTIAFDPPDEGGMRQLVKMLGSSIVRTGFSGDMAIFRNSVQPIFVAGRPGIEEVQIDTPALHGTPLADYSRSWKTNGGDHFEPANYRWIVFLDADCLCLRNIDHLLSERDCDILYQVETGRRRSEAPYHSYLTSGEMDEPATRCGINSGAWAVRGSLYCEAMQQWAAIQSGSPLRGDHWREQGAWNRLILDAAALGWRAEPFEAHEIQFPFGADKDWNLYRDAAVIHCAGAPLMDKISFLYGLYMQRFFLDRACSVLNLLET